MFGPSIDTTKESLRKALDYEVEGKDNVCLHIASVYKNVMLFANLSLGSIPCMLAEDETIVKRCIRWVARSYLLLGFCGKKTNHEYVENFVVLAGSGVDGYERIMNAFRNNMIAHYARVIIINPMHARLPCLVLVVMFTCNRFDHHFGRRQWKRVKDLWDTHLLCGLDLFWDIFLMGIQ